MLGTIDNPQTKTPVDRVTRLGIAYELIQQRHKRKQVFLDRQVKLIDVLEVDGDWSELSA